MTYLEAVALLHDIEEKYDVMSIQYKGISVWSFLRNRLLDCVSVNKEVKLSASVVSIVLKSLFYGTPFRAFSKAEVWSFTAAERRKQVGSKMVHRISGSVSDLPFRTLMIEKPDSNIGHYRQSQIEEKNIVSEAFLLLFSNIFKRLSVIKKSSITNWHLMDKILNDYHLTFDYVSYVRHLEAQRKAMNLMLAFFKKPKLVLFECSYTSMGYLWAFHQHKIKVVEMQHGVLNRNHNAYNAKNYDKNLNPDCIFVFGVEEYDFFKKEAINYAPEVEITGLYMLEKADSFFESDIFANERRHYTHITVVSGQTGFEEQLGSYINDKAGQYPHDLFVYIPRNDDVVLNFSHNNVRLVKGVNIYQYLKWADLHITISSTTCLEAHYFHTPTLFYNYQEMASTYYRSVLSPKNGVAYLSLNDNFNEAYEHLLTSNFDYKEIFAHNHVKRIEQIINKEIR